MYFLAVFYLLMSAVKSENFSVTNGSVYTGNSHHSELPGCYNKFVGSEGSVQNLASHLYSMVCEWDIDVTRGFSVELEFEVFRLPVNKERNCDSYIEITYSQSKDEVVKRLICPTDNVETISTGSQTVHIHFKSAVNAKGYGNDTYGFKINYKAVAAVTRSSGSQAVTFVLSSFAVFIIISGVFCCIRAHYNFKRIDNVPRYEVTLQQPNAPTRDDLEFQQHILQAPQIERKYLSRTSSVKSAVESRESYQNRSPHALAASTQGDPKISIGATPHLVLDEMRRKWSSESARRIQNLRTRLVARFSSHSSSDISVFFDAPDRRSYSQLKCEDDRSPGEQPAKPDLKSKGIPSVVIELCD